MKSNSGWVNICVRPVGDGWICGLPYWVRNADIGAAKVRRFTDESCSAPHRCREIKEGVWLVPMDQGGKFMTTFDEAVTLYRQAQGRWQACREDAVTVRQELSEIRQQVKDSEACAIVNGVTERPFVGGEDKRAAKNAEERTAVLAWWLERDGPYQALLGHQAEKEAELARLELDAEDAGYALRLARLQCEWAIAESQREAALLGVGELEARKR